ANDQRFFEFAPVAALFDIEIARGGKGRGEILGEGRHRLNHDADTRASGVERHAIAEQEQKDQRQHECDEDAARIADDLVSLLSDQGDEASRPAARLVRWIVHDRCPHQFTSASEPCTRAMKASSMVGSGWSLEATLALSSSGDPSAIDLPR